MFDICGLLLDAGRLGCATHWKRKDILLRAVTTLRNGFFRRKLVLWRSWAGDQRPSDDRDDARRDYRHVEVNQRVASLMIDSFVIFLRTNE